ncbi:MAG: hypothetical protein KGZ71_07920 [Desulfobulbaceae bacterium]|nr:hypothetical protein [Candidatus Kapabacteria bacterium]MBS4000391.1 hypothetical protein [Desulfobulbaceae bacterium]
MDKKLFIGLFFSFIAATIIGTLSHEFGHYIVAKYQGFEARINYSATFWESLDPEHPILPSSRIAVALGGPIQTMLTGTIGLVLLFGYRKKLYQTDKLSLGQWLIIFLSLFWLRQTANFCMWLTGYFLNGRFSTGYDEIRIANYFDLPIWSIILITAIIGAFVLAIITFKFIPPRQRTTFLMAGLLGGIAGFYLWLIKFGKYILP